MTGGDFGAVLQEKYAEVSTPEWLGYADQYHKQGDMWLFACNALWHLMELGALTRDDTQIALDLARRKEFGAASRRIEPMLNEYLHKPHCSD